MFNLAGRTALVTGAGQGVGFGIAEALIEAGATVIVNDLVADRAESAAVRLGPSATPLAFDVGDYPTVRAAVESAGTIDILVNNAGIPPAMRPRPFRELEPAEWAPYVDVNLYGVLNCVKATIDQMCERSWGRVVTISSAAAMQGMGIGVAAYAAGKGGGISFMRHLAVECARDGVTANTIALGLMVREATEVDAGSQTLTDRLARTIPVGRLGTGRDAGAACVFLASDEASWITGQTIGVNGGSSTS